MVTGESGKSNLPVPLHKSQECAISFRGLDSFRQEFVAEVQRRLEASFQFQYGSILAIPDTCKS